MHLRFLRWSVCATVCSIPAVLHGSGFGLEPTAAGLGMGGAFTADATNPAAVFRNPGAAAFQRWRNLSIGTGLVVSQVDFTGTDPFPGAGRVESQGWAPLVPLSLSYTHQVTERAVIGLTVDQPQTAKIRWSNPASFSGRFLAESTSLRSDSIRPLLAYKLADRLGAALAIDLRFTSFQFRKHVGAINPLTQRAVDLGTLSVATSRRLKLGFSAGLLARPGDNVALGLAYRHPITTSFEGEASSSALSTGDAQVDARLTAFLPGNGTPFQARLGLPAVLAGGIAYSPGDWLILADASWTRWSTLAPLEIALTERPDVSSRIVGASQDTLGYRFGFERRLGSAWTVRAGYSYAGGAVPEASVTPGLVECPHDVFAAGFTWRPGRVWIEVGDSYARARACSTDGGSEGGFEGTYSGLRNFLGARLGWSF